MMISRRAFYLVAFLLASAVGHPVLAQDSTLSIIIVAGQSNALNWHADATLLDSSSADRNIPFYYHTGIPPSKTPSDPFNATSDSQWTTLGHQTQRPYKLYHEEFFGPEITLAREIYSILPGVAVIKCVYAGSSLATDWKKGIGTGNQLYELMMAQISIALEQLDSAGVQHSFAGFFWMQGESDATSASEANAYEVNLSQFILNVRNDLNTPNLRFILGRIGTHLPVSFAYKAIVRTSQMNVAASDASVAWVDIDDLPLDVDNVHLVADGVKSLGVRMAHSWSALATGTQVRSFEQGPNEPSLSCFPNPFNPFTTISFRLRRASYTKLSVHDILGRVMVVLVSEELRAGEHFEVWRPDLLSSGIYYCRLQIGSRVESMKMLYVR